MKAGLAVGVLWQINSLRGDHLIRFTRNLQSRTNRREKKKVIKVALLIRNKRSSNKKIIDKTHNLNVQKVDLLTRILLSCSSMLLKPVNGMLIRALLAQVASRLGSNGPGANIWLSNAIFWLHDGGFMTTCEDAAPSDAMRWREKDGITRRGGVYRKNWCWLVEGTWVSVIPDISASDVKPVE